MSVEIKSEEAITKMKRAGRLASEVLEMIGPYVQPGVTTGYLDAICHNHIVNEQDAWPAPLNYHGFPKSVCTSVNHVICHGIPSYNKKLKKGDIINIDVTVIKDGYHGDTSKMFVCGEPSILAKRLINTTYEAMFEGIRSVKPGATLKDVAAGIEKIAHQQHFSVVEAFCGHGIGTRFHEDPQVLHYVGRTSRDHSLQSLELKPGMTFTIEPMINAGKKNASVLKDGWTAVTKDRSLSAQWEHTLLVTQTGYEVLTLRQQEQNISP
jgi:methionyl aminopeptidase